MVKMKLSLCVFCCFSVVVFGSGSTEFGSASKSKPEDSRNTTSNLNPSVNSELSLVLQRLEAQELRIQELKKFGEECKSLKMFYQKSHEELRNQFRSSKKKWDEQFKTLRKEVDEIKAENCVGEDVWLLTPPIRGRRGQKGEKGDSGPNGRAGKAGEKGEMGQNGGAGPKGDRGEKGERGQVGPEGQRGDKGEPGPKGERGFSAAALEASITSCSVAMELLPTPRSQKQRIYSHENGTSLEVLCDFETDGGGWTVIQKRTKGPKEEFKQNWTEYETGFGSVDQNFWLGLDNIRALTKNGDQELRIELEDFEGEKKWAKYSNFSISDASDFYRLTLEGFSGGSTLRDSMTYHHNGQRFSTIDKDNDNHPGLNCAVRYGGGGGGWFDKYCGNSNLNGLYFEKEETVPSYQGIYWFDWKGYEYSMAKTEMKIRKRKP